MKNQKIDTRLGTLIILIIAVTAGAFVWQLEKEHVLQTQTPNLSSTKKQPVKNGEMHENKTRLVPYNQHQKNDESDKNEFNDIQIAELMKNPSFYTSNLFKFKFGYPNGYSIEAHENETYGEYFAKDTSQNVTDIKYIKWKKFIIQDGTPGTEYQKRAYSDWKYILDNFTQIQSGDCNNNLRVHIPGQTIADLPKTCIVDKQKNYIKVETENYVIYYTADGEISFGGALENSNLTQKIAETFKML